MKKITLLLFALFSCWQIQAQVSLYTFAQSNETYTEITGGTVLGEATTATSFDSQNWTIATGTIPFNFNFNGVDYTGCTINSNGYITFGATAPAVGTALPISSTNAYSGAVSAWGGDLCGVFIASIITSEARWEVVGTAPNREFVVQFKNWRPAYSASIVNVPFFNFQIRLAETTNQVKIVYGSNGYAIGTDFISGTRQIGLRGAANTDFKNRANTTTQLFTTSTAGTLNSSSQAFNTITTTPGMPSSGLVYTFTPPVACAGAPVAGTVAPAIQNLCAGGTPAVIRLTGNSEGFTGLTFQWETSSDNVTWANATGASATTVNYSPPTFTGPGTVYYRCKITCTNSTEFSYSNVVTVNPAANPTAQATNLTFTNISYFGFTANWTNADGNRRVVYISDAPIVDPTNGSGPALVPATVYAGTGQQIVFDGTGTTVSVTGLNLSTQYYVKVIEYLRCGTAAPFDYYYNTTAASNANTVTTLPPDPLPWEEGFTTTTFPVNWVNSSSWVTNTTAALNPALSTNYLYKNIWSAAPNGNFLTPVFAGSAVNHRLVFNYKLANYSAPYDPPADGSGNFVVEISTNNGTSYVPLSTLNNNGLAGWQTYSFDLSAYVNQNIRIRITATWVSGDYYVAFDNFKIEPIPTCEAPLLTSLIANNITASTATISWTATTTVPANGYEYFVSTSATAPTASSVPTGTVPTGVSVNLLGLPAQTTHYVWVRSNCATNDVSNWSGPVTFKTQCDDVITFSENFDSPSQSTVFNGPLPECWNKGLVGVPTMYITTGSVAPMSPDKRLIMTATAAGTAPTQAFAILPPVSNLQANTHRLRFKAYATVANRTVSVGYMTDYTNTGSFVELQQITLPGTAATTATEFIVIPGALPAGVKYLAIRNNGFFGTPLGSTTAYFDDFSWEAIPTCIEPSGLTASAITNTTATLGWTEAATATAWEIEYGAPGFVQGSAAGTIVPAATNPFTLTALTPNTNYVYYVRAVCSTTESSFWTGPFAFKTQCDEVTSFTENFDAASQSTAFNGPLPDCWTKGLVGTPTLYVTTGSLAPMSPTKRMVMTVSSTATPAQQAYAILPPVSNLNAGTHRLRFKAFATAVDRFVELGYLTDPSDLSTFAFLTSFQVPGTVVANTQQFIYAPDVTIPAGVKHLAILNPGYPGGSSTIYIDDVYWELTPTTIPACASNVVATPNATCGNFATSITWDVVPGADGYKLKLGTTPGGSEILDTQNIGLLNSYSFVGNFNTTYYYTIIPYNGFGDATGCTELSFATAVNGCYCTSLPTSNDGLGITNVLLGTTNFPTTDVTYFDHTATQVSLQQAVNTNVQISFATGYTYNTYIWIDFNDNLTFESSELVFTGESPNTNPIVYNASFLMPATATLGTHRMRIVTADTLTTPNPCYSGSFGVTLDFSVNIVPAPSCIPPVNLTATGITSSSANLGWTESGSATVWDIEWGTAGFTPTGTPNIVGTTTNPQNLTGLLSNTGYSFYVRANCGGTAGFSNWSGPFSFFTSCEATNVPYVMDFETAVVPALPNCTSVQNVGTGNVWTVANNPGSGFTSKTLQYIYNSTNAANVWFFTQALNLTAGTTYTIAFDYGSNSTFFVEKLKVAYGTSANAASMTNLVVDLPNIINNTPLNSSTEFTPTTTGVYYFGFNAYSIANQFNLYVDNINVQLSLSTGSFDTANFSYYPNPVTDILTLSYSDVISEVVVYNLLGQQVVTVKPNANQTQVDLSSLTAGTYIVKVTSDEVTKTVKVVKN